MATRLTSSTLYAHLWGTAELAGIFEERAMLQSWLDILAALARAQSTLDIVPAGSAAAITAAARVDALDLHYVAEQTRVTSHSTLGLIRGLLRVLPAQVREHVYVGATVQDVTDTWFGLVMHRVGEIVQRELTELEGLLLDLAQRYRDTVMPGRTHGQPGAPITFGFKVASWADEVHRQLERMCDGRGRWPVGQLGGAVGVLAFFGPAGTQLRARFCAEIGLADPGISWFTARDRVAEFGSVLAMVCGTLARIGTEVYELARPEIGELSEAAPPGAVSSITMPHKRNPEGSEHLDTLARLARSSAAVLVEGMVGGHERDGRSWKAEWVALPEVCQLTGAALALARTLVDGLEVHPEAMARNVDRFGAGLGSERVLAGLSAQLGKHRAQQALHEILREDDSDLATGLSTRGLATEAQVRAWATAPAVDAATAMVDTVLARARLPNPASRGIRATESRDSGELPRVRLAVLPTPLVRARRLERALGCGPLLVKRDDLIGFGVAGNKTRPLELLLGAALAQGAEVFVTGGGPGSNFCPAAAQAARVAGLDCELVVWGDASSPSLALARAAGARLLPTGRSVRAEVDERVAARVAELTAAGRPAYGVPRGGSTGLGAVGFALAAAELGAQLAAQQAAEPVGQPMAEQAGPPAVIVLPVGSGGSCAGLLAGLGRVGLDVPVVGVSVSRPPDEIEHRVHELARECAALFAAPAPPSPRLELVDARRPAFGVASDLERDRSALALHTEGWLLDETYGAKAFSVAVDRLRAGGPGPVLWWHTGGLLPALGSTTGRKGPP